MMGITHTVVTAISVFCCSEDFIITSLAAFSARLPDQLESYLPFCKHRGITHWLFFWGTFVALLLSPQFCNFDCLPRHSLLWKAVLGIGVGGLSHVLQDGLSRQGVPIIPGVHLKGRLYSTGNISEYIVAGLLSLGFIYSYFFLA